MYRVGNHQPQNVYRGDQYIGVMFNPEDAAEYVKRMNEDPLEGATGFELLSELEIRGNLDDDEDGTVLRLRIGALRTELDPYTLESRRKDYTPDEPEPV